jgi:hypothetical protein
LGKTTFIYNLVSGFKVQNPGRAHMEGATTMVQFKTDPNGLRTVLAPLEMPESNERVQISVQVGGRRHGRADVCAESWHMCRQLPLGARTCYSLW